MTTCEEQPKTLGWISKLLALWIAIAIVIGLALGKYLPGFSSTLEVGIPIGLFFMIYPAMTKIEISELKKAVRSPKQTGIIVFFNYAVNPFLLLPALDSSINRTSIWWMPFSRISSNLSCVISWLHSSKTSLVCGSMMS